MERSIIPPPPPGASLSPKRHTQDRRDSSIRPLCGKKPEIQARMAPKRCPYPPNGPGRTGVTRMYLPPCGEELEIQTRLAPHGASLSPERPRQDQRDSVVSPLCGGKWEGQTYPTPQRGVPISQTAQA